MLISVVIQCSQYCKYKKNKRYEEVKCLDNLFRILDPTKCPAKVKPELEKLCADYDCSSYTWRPLSWSKVSLILLF